MKYYVWHGTTYCEHHLPTVALGAASRFEGPSIPTCAECPSRPELAAGGLVEVSPGVASWPPVGVYQPGEEPTVIEDRVEPATFTHSARRIRTYSDGTKRVDILGFHKEIPLEAVDLLLRKHFSQGS